jgi:AcrR family transcriptional regulator
MTAVLNPRRTYHHGDLRRSLIEVALTRVRQDGVEALSLREIAREAGVTVGAVYKHFGDKEELLAAVALEGFRLLAGMTESATSGRRGKARVMAVGDAYIDFASSDARLFRLMFSRLGMQRARSPLGAGMQGAYEQLRQAIADAQGITPEAVVVDLLAVAWSVAHGAASLISDGVWKPNDARARAALARVTTLIDTPRR